MLVEMTQLAKFLNGVFVMAWHLLVSLLTLLLKLCMKKNQQSCAFHFVALAVCESVGGRYFLS